MRYDQELLDVALGLQGLGITGDQTTRLHHFSVASRPRRETIEDTIRYVRKRMQREGAQVRGANNVNYYSRLIWLHENLKNAGRGDGVPEHFVDKALVLYPLRAAEGATDRHATGEVALTVRSMSELVAYAEREEAGLLKVLDVPGRDLSPAFVPAAIEDSRERVAREIAVRRGQPAFRRQLLEAYGCCAMTGCTVKDVLEAAHIVPYQGPGTNHLSNGLLLRADLHTLFDLGALAVDADTLEILVSPRLDGTEYESLRGQALQVGTGTAAPSREALRIHRAFAEKTVRGKT